MSPEPLRADQQDTEVRWCRIHPRAQHRQRAVCQACAEPFQAGQPTCWHAPLAPHFRCIEHLSS